MLAGGAAAAAGTYALGRFGQGVLGKLGRGAVGTAGGVAVGKALESTAGVQPVFVVNMPAGIGGDMPGMPGKNGKTGGKGVSKFPAVGALLPAAALGGTMYGVTRWAGQREKYDERAKGMVEFSGSLEKALRKMFGWAGYQTEQEKYLKNRAQQLKDTSPGDAQKYQAQYEKVKALLDGTAQQSEAAIKQAGEAVVSSNQAVSQALITQVGNTEIKGNIGITVTASPLLQVQTTAVGNGNTALNVGKTNTGAK